MTPTRAPFVAHPRNPVTGRQFRVVASTAAELAQILARVDQLRRELRIRRQLAHRGRTDEPAPEALCDEVRDEIRVLEHGRLTLAHAASAYGRRRDLAADTRRRVVSWMHAAGRPLMPLPLDSLDVGRLATWIEGLRADGLRPSTIDSHWRTLCAIVKHATDRGWIVRCPWGDYRPRFRDRAPRLRESARTPDELSALLAAAFELDAEREAAGRLGDLEAKVACASLLGLRQRELARLGWRGIRRDERQVIFSPAKTAGPASRTIGLGAIPELFEIVERYRLRLESRRLYDPDGSVFVRPDSAADRPRPYSKGPVLTSRDLRSAVLRAGLPNIQAWSAHSLRDSFVSLEHSAHGNDLAITMLRSRHGSISSLFRYLRTIGRGPVEPGFRLPPREPARALPPAPQGLKKQLR